MKIERTERGFVKGNFDDDYGHPCSIQESSVMGDEGYIWFGINDAKPEYCPRDGTGWHPLPLPSWVESTMDVIFHTRMHLSQTQVKELLPTLQYFAEHGYLPEEQFQD